MKNKRTKKKKRRKSTLLKYPKLAGLLTENKKYLSLIKILLILNLVFLVINISLIYKQYKNFLIFDYTTKKVLNQKGISEQEAKKYIGQNVCIIRDDFIKLYVVYGMIVSVFEYEGEWNLLLKMTYRDQKEMIIKLKDIIYIRERLPNE